MRGQFDTSKYIKFFLYLAALILLNIVGLNTFFRIDLTKNNLYSLSKASKKSVSSLSEPLTIKVYFTKDLPPPYNTLQRYMGDLLEEYSLYSNKNFNFQIHELGSQDEELKNEAKGYGIRPVQVQVIQQDELQYKQAYMGAVIIHGDAVEKLSTISSVNGLEYDLTSALEKLKNKVSALLNLKEKVKVKLFLSSSLEKIAPQLGLKQMPELPEQIKSIVQELNTSNYNKLKYEFIDPSKSELSEKSLNQYQLNQLQWPDFKQANIEAGQGTIGLVLEHKDKFKSINILNVVKLPILGTQYSLMEAENLRESIEQNLKSLLGINQTLGYLASHGTPALNRYSRQRKQDQRQLGIFNQLISDNYTLKEISLEEGIPEGLNCLLIPGPREGFTDHELYQLDQALMRGTNLAFFLDGIVQAEQNQQSYGQAQYKALNTGLDKLLNHYGLELEKSLILDENCYMQKMPQRQGGGERPIYFAPIIKNKHIKHELEFMKNIKGLVAFKVSPVSLKQDNLDKHQAKSWKLMGTSEKSWTMSKRINLNPMLLSPPKDKDKQYSRNLACLAEGKFKSYFADREIPEKEIKEDKEENATSEKSSTETNLSSSLQAENAKLNQSPKAKIFLMGSSAMLTDTVLDPDGESPNSVFVMNIIDALNNRTPMAVLRGKTQEFNPLTVTSDKTKLLIKSFNIVGVPALVVLFGAFVWLNRRRYRNTLKKMF